MSTIAAIPVTVEPEAAARVAELGMQREFEEMLEHTRRTVPGLRAIHVTPDYDPYGTEEPGVIVWSHRPEPGPAYDPVDDDWGMWKINTFPPRVYVHFCMMSLYEVAADGR